MAVTKPIVLTFTIADGSVPVKYAAMKFNIPVTFSGAQREAFAEAFAQVIDDMIEGAIVKITLTTEVDLPASGLKGAGNPGSDVEEGAEFSWATAVGYPSTNRVPTFSESQYESLGDSRNVDQGNTEVAAFIDAVLSGILAGGAQVQPSDSHGVDLTVIRGARQMHQKERRS